MTGAGNVFNTFEECNGEGGSTLDGTWFLTYGKASAVLPNISKDKENKG
jgi:hypothetical protein